MFSRFYHLHGCDSLYNACSFTCIFRKPAALLQGIEMIKPLAFIIEHDQNLADIAATALELAGYKTEIISDGQSALKRLAATAPNVIVLTLHLPYLPAKVILHHIRNSVHLVQSRIIITTPDPLLTNRLHSPVDSSLTKPVSFIQLRDTSAGSFLS